MGLVEHAGQARVYTIRASLVACGEQYKHRGTIRKHQKESIVCDMRHGKRERGQRGVEAGLGLEEGHQREWREQRCWNREERGGKR